MKAGKITCIINNEAYAVPPRLYPPYWFMAAAPRGQAEEPVGGFKAPLAEAEDAAAQQRNAEAVTEAKG